MRYEKQFNKALNVWQVWRVCGYTAEVVKRFKTERAADNWIARQG